MSNKFETAIDKTLDLKPAVEAPVTTPDKKAEDVAGETEKKAMKQVEGAQI